MTYELKNNSGSIWVNDKKETDNQPDRTGSVMIDGREYWINGWLKQTGDGKSFMSLSFKPKEARNSPPARQAPPSRQPPPRRYEDDDRTSF